MVLLSSAISLVLLCSVHALPVAKPRSQAKTIPVKHHRLPSNVNQALRARDSSGKSTPATNMLNFYTVDVEVGNQSFELVVDTASSNIWVGQTTKYVPSSTSKDTGAAVSLVYDDEQNFSGEEFIDTVSVGSAQVTAQSLGVASSSTGFEFDPPIDGVFGIGPEALTSNTVDGLSLVPTFPQNLLAEGQVSSNIVGISFVPENGQDEDDVNGEITFGDVDSTKFTGEITFLPLSTDPAFSVFWSADAASLTLGSASLDGPFSIAFDSSTPFLLLPDPAVNSLLSATGGNINSDLGTVAFNTEPTDNLVFTFGGVVLTLTPAQYLVPQAEVELFGLPEGQFYSWIASTGSDGALVGMPWFEAYYTVLDTDNNRIGFAPSSA